jgi:hypothetical protein
MGISGQLYSPAVLFPEKILLYVFNRRLGGSQSRSESFGEEMNLLPRPGIDPRLHGCPVRIVVIIPTALSWLSVTQNFVKRVSCSVEEAKYKIIIS